MPENYNPPKFIHLRNHTEFSLSEGALRISETPDLCIQNGMPAAAITDSGNLFGIMQFSKTLSSKGVQPIIGCEIFVEGSKLVLYAKDEAGYQNLLKLVSLSFLESSSPDNASVDLKIIEQYSEGLLCLTASYEGELSKLILAGEDDKALAFAERLLGIFGDRLYIELTRHGFEKEEKAEKKLIEVAYDLNIPLIATNNCFYATPDMFEAHDALLCIAQGKVVVDENRERLNEEFYFKSADEMLELFADIPEATANTVQFAKRCHIKAEPRNPLLPDYETDRTAEDELKHQATEGLKARLGKGELPQDYQERLDYELGIINKMQFPGYFLIVSDFIKWSKEQKIPVGPGRGSGAGSLVAWSLQITDVDPLQFGLLFERFLNPERVSMPDFDIDFCQERREEVIQYVRQKYGNDRVSQIITFGKLQARAVVRDVARVLQIPYMEADRISKMIPFNPVNPVTLAQAIELDPEMRRLQKDDETIGKLLDISLKLEGLNRHASTHAAGILIADRPLDELVPLYRDPRSDIPVSQFSMKDAETAGLVKFDFLGLKTLTLVDKSLKFIEERSEKFDILDIPLDKPEVFEMLSKGDTVGVFQLDSSLVRDAIRKMKPDKFEDIVALTSLCRPGPMENIPTYVARKHGKEKTEYPHDKLSNMLEETYGIMVYQEQVMEAAQILSGYSLGKADLLRRAMGKKIKAEMDSQREMFSEGAKENGIDKKQAAGIFDLIAKFAGYGFNKSHAVAYALIAYQTAYLRCYYPVEFFAACMNIDIGDTDKISFFKHEAIKCGIEVLGPDVNSSEAFFTPEGGKIKYGLGALKGVGIEATKAMISERSNGGLFKSIYDLCSRCDPKVINKKHLESLAKAGALDGIHDNRAEVFESADLLSRFCNASNQEKNSDQISLFGAAETQEISKPQLAQVADWKKTERLEKEFEAIGFYLSSHPLVEYEKALEKLRVIPSVELEDRVNKDGMKIRVAGVVANRKLRSGKKGRFGFAKVSDAFGVYEIVMYDDDLIGRSVDLLDSGEPLLISAEARKDEGGIRVIATDIELLGNALKKDFSKYTETEVYNLYIDNEESTTTLCELLKKNAFNDNAFTKTTVTLMVISGGKEVELKLPGHFVLEEDIKDELLELSGVWVA